MQIKQAVVPRRKVSLFFLPVIALAIFAVLSRNAEQPDAHGQTDSDGAASGVAVSTNNISHETEVSSDSSSEASVDGSRRNHFVSLPTPPEQKPVITAFDNEDGDWEGYNDAGIRSRAVILNGAMLRGGVIPKDTQIRLQLFDDVTVDAVVSESFRNVNGTVSTTATIEDSQFGRVFIASTDGELHARIRDVDNHKLYGIQFNHETGKHYALELDVALAEPDDCKTCGEPHMQMWASDVSHFYKQEAAGSPVYMFSESTEALAVVDVMVVYTETTLNQAGSQAAVDNKIALGISMANDAHATTVTHIVLYLVHAYAVEDPETDGVEADLYWLTDDEGVGDVRDDYGADFVVMMTAADDGAGIAHLLMLPDGRPERAFSVVGKSAFASYTVAHEVGHNMGLSHAVDQIQTTGPGPTRWQPDTYNWGDSTAGWHWHPDDNHDVDGWCSIMTYSGAQFFEPSHAGNHTRVGLFSDPDIIHNGEPAGHEELGYNARVLRELRHVYAGYRSRLDGEQIVVDYPSGGETLTAGQTYSLLWDSSGVPGNVKIELLQNGDLDSVIAEDTLNDRTYAWTVPFGKSGVGYAIRVRDVATGEVVGTSEGSFAIETPFYVEMLDEDPGFTTTGGWEFGVPGGDNETFGGPGSAFNGVNIYDTNLQGVSTETGYLTTEAIDCSNYENIQLTFMGWFSVTEGYLAVVEASNNGSDWIELFSASDTWTTSWQPYSFDISSIADGESSVFIRWGHIEEDGGGNYSGMSVDDIVVTGIYTDDVPHVFVNPDWFVPSATAGSSPSSQTFVLRNNGAGEVNYSITVDESWLFVSPMSGSVGSGEDLITVSYATVDLPEGVHTAKITVTDDEAGNSPLTIPVTLSLEPIAFYHETFDSNPGWSLEGDWEFGPPAGGGGYYGARNPTYAYRGENVIGYNLRGGYASNMTETVWATTTAIDCSGYENIRIGFMRWLNINKFVFDKAYIAVSVDGLTWTKIWQNDSHIFESSWGYVEYDISALADGEDTVYVRWGIGPTVHDAGGWNIDDVKLKGTPILTGFQQWLAQYDYPVGATPEMIASNSVNTYYEMYIAGLDPTDPDSRFVIGGVSAGVGDGPVLQWQGVEGRLYSVFWSSNLLDGAEGFQVLQSNIPWSANISFTDIVERTSNEIFYRIEVQLDE